MDEHARAVALLSASTTRREGRVKLYQLGASCPKCGARPGVKVYESELLEKGGKPADWRPRRSSVHWCPEIYTITAAAYHRAA